ncbi:MAG: M15 family metallopeptidase [Flavobacteriaceae bacterium]|nr:M15 family metallopeptidase [Flavobacteriaceae bacterium]
MRTYFLYSTLILIVFGSCHKDHTELKQTIQDKKEKVNTLNKELNTHIDKAVVLDSLISIRSISYLNKESLLNSKSLDSFVNLEHLSDDFVFDLKYATADNFLKQAVYDCTACYTRLRTALVLLKINHELKDKGYRIKFFDCYRPLDVQKKMWEIYPNPSYIQNPAKGSIHNKGGAVDITLVDSLGAELDMGTPFDHFGKEAHRDYTELSEEVIANRKLLTDIMIKHGFWTIRTEWWHFNHLGGSQNKVENFTWDCD